MYAIISELNHNASREVNRIWAQLSNECELDAIFQLPTPHLTWMICQNFNVENTVPALTQVAIQENRISTRTTGLGIFTGETPVLYLPVVKNQKLLSFHQDLWQKLAGYANNLEELYSPEAWVPHITLAINDLTGDALTCAIDRLMLEPIQIEIVMDSLSLVEFEEDIAGEIIKRFPFGEPDQGSGSAP